MIGVVCLCVLACASTLVLFRALDMRGRFRWFERDGGARALAGPYRSTVLHRSGQIVAPPLVRAATIFSVLFSICAVPAVYKVLDTPHFDGIAVPLLPGLLLSISSAFCVSALLAGATDEASHAARLTGRTSLFFHSGLTVLAIAHLIIVETDWGSQVHACSRSLALGVLALALAATAQSFAVVRAAEATDKLRSLKEKCDPSRADAPESGPLRSPHA